MKIAVEFRLFVLVLTALGALCVSVNWRALRGWWSDRVQLHRARAEWKRRKRAYRAAQDALDPTDMLRDDARRKNGWFVLILVVGGAIVLALGGCGGRYPIDDAPAPADDAGSPTLQVDAGAAPDVHEPQCQPLLHGQEFYASVNMSTPAVLVLNDLDCSRVCRNSAGGTTCIDAGNALVDCRACQAVSP